MMTPTPLERLRAQLVTGIARRDDTIENARRQIAAFAERPDVRPQALVGDLRSYDRTITESAAARQALAEVLEHVEVLIDAPQARA